MGLAFAKVRWLKFAVEGVGIYIATSEWNPIATTLMPPAAATEPPSPGELSTSFED